MIEAGIETGEFFSLHQKEIKGTIMNALIATYNVMLEDNQKHFNPQLFADLITSILIMFNRDALVNFFIGCGQTDYKITGPVLDQLFKTIKVQVMTRLKEINEAKH